MTRLSTLTLCLVALLGAMTIVRADDAPIDLDHGKLFPRLLSELDLEKIIERDLNFTLGLLGLNRKRAGSARALTPSQVRSFYNVPGGTNAGAGQTVAIVVAYGASSVENDLATFNSRFSLPACTTSNGCFKKVDQNGGSSIPPDDTSNSNPANTWSGETNLDVQWVHSIAPAAKIILVCANSPSSADMYPAVRTAATLAPIVSMSWGGSEGSSVSSFSENIFTTGRSNGVSFFAATGDDGQPAGYPASSPNVVAVGGTTTFTNSDGTLASESAWSGSGGGCSSVYTMSNAQKTNSQAVAKCGSKRATPDFALDADPNSGVPVYLQGSWYQFGGTSLATPLASGRASAVRAALGGSPYDSAYFYGSTPSYRDTTTGSNANFAAGSGYDLSTGFGAWVGDATKTSTQASQTASQTKSTTKSSTTTTSTPSSTKCSGLLCLKK